MPDPDEVANEFGEDPAAAEDDSYAQGCGVDPDPEDEQ